MFLLRPRPEKRRRDAGSNATSVPPCAVRLAAQDWEYVAEGGANVIFRYRHQQEQPPCEQDAETAKAFQGKLLRVKKCDVILDGEEEVKNAAQEDAKALAHRAHYPHPRHIVEYARQEILPLLEQQVDCDRDGMRHRQYDQVAHLLDVDPGFLRSLNDALLALDTRPEHRRGSQIDVKLACVMVLPDLTLPLSNAEPSAAVTALQSVDRAVQSGVVVDGLDVAASTSETCCCDDGSSTNESTSSCGSEDDTSLDDEEDDNALLIGAIPPRVVFPRRNRACSLFDCGFGTICIEIKPKIGFKPMHPLLPDAKQQVCRFCMHQQYKRAQSQVAAISSYCPLDLFSRSPVRVHKALRDLQRTPQNNLKVLVRSRDGHLVNVLTGKRAGALPKSIAAVRPSATSWPRLFAPLAGSVGAMCDSGDEEDVEEDGLDVEGADREHMLAQVVDLLGHVLLETKILEDLKKMQMLDQLNVDGLWHLHRLLQRLESSAADRQRQHQDQRHSTLLGEMVDRLRSTLAADAARLAEEEDIHRAGSLARSIAFVQSALELPSTAPICPGISSWRDVSMSAFKHLYQVLEQRFHVATTLKDCSLMFCLRRSPDDGDDDDDDDDIDRDHAPRAVDHLDAYEHSLRFRGQVIECVAAVVDLDVKSHKSVEHYYQLDQKILQHFTRDGTANGGLTRECEDS